MKKQLASLGFVTALSVMALVGCGGGGETSVDSTSAAGTAQATQAEQAEETEAAEGSTDSSDSEKIFSIAIDYMPERLIPTLGTDSVTVMTRAIYDPLFYDSSEGFIPKLADSLDISEDGLTYTVHLNEDAVWSDGEPIDTDDLLFSIRYSEYDGGGVSNFTSYQGQPIELTKIDDKTLEFKLPVPNKLFIYRLANMNVIPEHGFDGDETIVDSSEYMITPGMATSGPFEVAEVNADSIVYAARDNYYGGTPKVDKVVCKVLGAGGTKQVAFESGELSYMRVITAEELAKYTADPDNYNVTSISEGRLNYIQMNPYGPVLSTLPDDARKAICLALNQEEIIMAAYGSEELAKPANSVLVPDQEMYDPDCPGYTQDLEEAKALAESSGLAGKTLNYIYNADRAGMDAVAVVIQQQLANIGVNVNVRGLDSPTFFSTFWGKSYGNGNEKTWDIGSNGWDSQYGSTIVQAGFYLNSQEQWGWSDEICDMTNKLNETNDQEEYNELAKELQAECLEEYRMYPLPYPNYVMVSHKNVTGLDKIPIVPEFADYASITVE